MGAMQESFVELNGVRFRVRQAGPEKADTIFLLHGGRGIGDLEGEWQAYGALSDEYRVIAYDQRGCGLSSGCGPMTFDQLAEDLESLRRHFCGDDGKIILQGGSFGGMIALTYAVRFPDRLSHLMLRGTAPSHHHEAEAATLFKARLGRAPSASVDMIDKLFSDRVADDDELRLIWFALQPLYYDRFDPDAALAATLKLHIHADTHNALFRDKTYDVRDKLGQVGVPVLAFCGESDWICPPSQTRLIAELCPNGTGWLVPGASHACHLEKADAVLARVREFLAEEPA